MPSTPDFKERLKQITLRNRTKVHRKHTTWPIEKKIEVVSQFLVLGNMKLVAATTGVSHDLIRQWKTQPWWAELEAEIRQTQNIEMDTKLSKIIDKSLDAVMDRLENGEYIVDHKTGQIKRKPASLRDTARVTVDILSKRELLRGNATERKEVSTISVQEQLKMLAAEFGKWQGKPPAEIVDAEFREVVEHSGESGEDEAISSEMEVEEQGPGEISGSQEESTIPTE